MRTERVSIAVPYRALATPKGARVSREIVCRTEMPADLRLARAEDMVPAVIACSWDYKPEATRTYRSFDNALWLPMADTSDDDGHLKVERALAQLAEGARYIGTTSNPFVRTGANRVFLDEFEKSKRIEDLKLRTFDRDDSAEVLANAARLSNDLLLCEDGRCYRRSLGPHVQVYGAAGMRVFASSFEAPHTASHQYFCAGRLEEAAEYGADRWSGFEPSIEGDLEILDRSHLPDGDALAVATVVADPGYAHFIVEAAEGRDAEVVFAADDVVRRIGRMHGVEPDVLLADFDRVAWPLGFAPPTPEEVVGVVDATRTFFARHMEGFSDKLSVGPGSTYAERFERRMAVTLARFDAFERHRLAIDEIPPDLTLPEGPRP